jgi:N-acetylneuraminate synthase
MWFKDAPERCCIIGEVGQNHDGSLGAAHAYIDAIARAGADAVKFQSHIAEAESSPDEPWRVQFSRQDATRFDYWKRMEFTEEQWCGLAAHAAERGLLFLSSAFSMRAVEMLERVGVPAWKVGAGEIGTLPMIERMARTKKPVLLSSGLASWGDLDRAVACVKRWAAPVAVFQCTTMYPCGPEKLGLNLLGQIRERYRCPVGLSDHSGLIYAGLAAAVMGAQFIEVHVTFSRECFGPDVPASLTTADLAQLVEGVRFVEKALAHPMDKDRMAEELAETRRMFGKSLVAVRDLPAGAEIEENDMTAKKPGTGLPPARMTEFLHRRLKRAVGANQRFSEDDFE